MAKEHLTVKHYLKTLEETVRQQWNQKALCDFGGRRVYVCRCGNKPELIRTTANKSLPVYSKINEVVFVDEPFEKTPKMSIKRYLYR